MMKSSNGVNKWREYSTRNPAQIFLKFQSGRLKINHAENY
jgi:hypothetical protein